MASAHIDHTSVDDLISTDEGVRELMSNLNADEFAELCDAMRILAISEVPTSRQLASTDIRNTLRRAARRIADFHYSARAFHTAQRVKAAYHQGAAR